MMTEPILPAPALVRAVSRASRGVVVMALAICVVTVAIAVAIGDSAAGWSALLGGGIGMVLSLVTVFTMGLAMRRLDLQIAFMMGDYLFKVIVMVIAVIVAKNLDSLDHRTLGITVILSIIAQAAIQMWILVSAKIPTIDPANSPQE
ncbi:MAG: hypothetical protein Q4P71_00655 [Actinomycetaceae bacterium]|nr:hypothetical protein [Actinomycetaceae bacterium]